MYRNKSIGIAVPAYNESKLIEKTLRSIPLYADKIYAVDDGSLDDTAEKIENFDDPRIVLIKQKNGGVGAAVTAGYKEALNDNIDIVTVMAGDNQMDPDYLTNLLDPIIDGKAEYTKGNRLSNAKYRKGMSTWRTLGNYLLNFLNKMASGYWNVSDPQNGYTAISNSALKKLDLDKVYRGYAFENDMLVKLNVHDIKVKNVSIPARYADEKSKIHYPTFIAKTSFYLINALLWRSWKKYIVKLNPIGIFYILGVLLTFAGFLAILTLKINYLILGLSLFFIASISEILRDKLLEAKFSNKVTSFDKINFKSLDKKMKIAFFINTPAHVHFHKYTIRELERLGYTVLILARNYGDTLVLLDELGFKYFTYSNVPDSKYGKIIDFPFSVFSAFLHLSKRKPDLLIGIGLYSTYTSLFLRKPCVIFTDSEPTRFQFMLIKPIVRAIITPSSFKMDLGPKQIKIDTYKEFAYLHANYFKPDPNIYNLLGISQGLDFVLLRFNAFDAVHDVGIKGFTTEEKRKLVREIEKHSEVFISSEVNLPEDLQKYSIKIPKYKIHDVLYYAKMVVADTQTIITEAAIMGTPGVRYNTFAGNNDMGNFIELEDKYHLIYSFNEPEKAINKVIELIQRSGLKNEWTKKRDLLLADKIDATQFMISFIRSYPFSLTREFKEQGLEETWNISQSDLS